MKIISPDDICDYYDTKDLISLVRSNLNPDIINLKIDTSDKTPLYNVISSFEFITIFEYALKALYPWIIENIGGDINFKLDIRYRISLKAKIDLLNHSYKIIDKNTFKVLIKGKFKLWD